ncbi:hypothetical protein BABINDRAFT_162061 [Babjeviella inositovora NRRL Y-12698]|uniref:SPX domain-containing protein n=1 Tax=Babjeviella inositovora NRRL Y-12698 TaxID=984486 RepID=A0A1E3QMR3_9ASCO|nr:uncharacterized protein BABINDRAFT_162061 [Babjeviella inositovora NRRL Y-12698]ODQ78979.1 hypothetical protein BABINDRAFT_162061 [Babjeviella inositovora NRRL Y-12698]
MKFSHSLQFNAVPEWADHYLNYDGLKKTIYELEQQVLDEAASTTSSATIEGAASSPFRDSTKGAKKMFSKFSGKLKRGDSDSDSDVAENTAECDIELQSTYSGAFNPRKIFVAKLNHELNKIDRFYKEKEAETYKEFNLLAENLSMVYPDTSQAHVMGDTASQFSRGHTRALSGLSAPDHEDDEDVELDDYDESNPNTALLKASDLTIKDQEQIKLKKKLTILFVELSSLKSYVELNRIGFTKICKKFDKVHSETLKADYCSELPATSYIFQEETVTEMDTKIDATILDYATLMGQNDILKARQELRSHLREHIVWERNTVWKDMLGLEKARHQIDAQKGLMGDTVFHRLNHMDWATFTVPKSEFTIKYPAFLISWQIAKVLLAIVVTVVLLVVKTFHDQQQHNCMALLACAAILWATEAIPLFATSLLIPFLVVTFKVLKNTDGSPMNGADSATYILGQMWNSVIMVLLGGFTLAAALSKYNIAKVLSSYILTIAGSSPRNVLLAIMCVALFLAMWISNVASPVLCFSLIQPVLRTLETDSDFAQALIMGIALASNVAGMASPISSPQNVIALQYMSPNPGWGKWFAVALPVSIVCMLLIWLELCISYPKMQKHKMQAFKPIVEKFSTKQWYICVITVLTIVLWCLVNQLEQQFGAAGVVAIIPIIAFYATGILTTEDVNNYPWSIVLLAMGGLALGKAITSSGLLALIAKSLQLRIQDYSLFVIMMIFGLVVLGFATFVSHTVAALIIIPLVKEIGDALPHPHSLLLIMASVLMASGAMGLPTSGFPNVTAISMVDELGKPYLTVNGFITRGVPASIICFVVIITLGYGIMSGIGF